MRAQDQDTLRTTQLDSVVIVGVSPLSGGLIATDRLPMRVQAIGQPALQQSQGLDLTDFMNRSLGSLHVNEAGGNPLQPDVNLRGFTASPLLGVPQGIAVYQDGFRVNELFGDVVNWDLVPRNAIADVELMAGANPVYGANALGGALSIRTKTGFDQPGHELMARGGSFGRYILDASSGGNRGRWGYFVSANHFREQGWRDFSASNSTQLFGKASYVHQADEAHVSVLGVVSDLRGNGAIPVELLEQSRSAVFTHPDNTRNEAIVINGQYTRRFSTYFRLDLNLNYKVRNTDTFNGDDTPYEANEDGFLVEDEDELVFDQFGNPVQATDAVSSATNNTTDTQQRTVGTGLQFTYDRPLAGSKNTLVAGVNYEGGHIDFASQTEFAELTETRGTRGSGLFDAESFTRLRVRAYQASAYVFDAFSPTQKLTLTAGLRLSYQSVQLRDQLGTALNGDHDFVQLNPTIGATYRVSTLINAYISYSFSSRAPTPVELTCADPEAPCRLPNSFLSDPPLDLVVARTLEGGLHGQLRQARWNTGVFRTDLVNDIYFVSSGPFRNSGYFTNIGNTLRQGIELGISRQIGRVRGQVHYTYQQATFEEDFFVNSPEHPEEIGGEINVRRGNAIPLIPQHIFKFNVDVEVTEKWLVGADLVYNGAQFYRGDEANLLDPLPGYTVIGLRTQYQLTPRWRLFGQVRNVLNTEYSTLGLLGEADELPGFEDFEDPFFVTPAAPRNFLLGFLLSL